MQESLHQIDILKSSYKSGLLDWLDASIEIPVAEKRC